jgi:hypothetical protein
MASAEHDPVWGPTAPRSAPIRHGAGQAVGTDTVGAAVTHLHREHPFHVQGEDLQSKATKAIHHPVTTRVYGDKGGV